MDTHELLLAEILDSIPFPVAIYTFERHPHFCNQAFLNQYGSIFSLQETSYANVNAASLYHRISRLPDAIQRFQSGSSTQQSDLFSGTRRSYTLLRQATPPLVLEMLVPSEIPLDNNERPYRFSTDSMILSDWNMHGIVETIQRIANFDSTILITGEAGTGKTSLAKYIHSTSRRASQPFVSIDCTSIPENLIEAELFGYVSSASTHTQPKETMGLVEAANNGTLFLDEVCALPLNLQSKFLQLMQGKGFFPVGGTERKHSNLRIISATRQDLKKQVDNGHFREDLYYRLRVIEFHVPPLRERADAMDPLIDHFLSIYNRKYHTSKTCSPKARDSLKRHSWSGNISELQYVIERAVVTSMNDEISSGDIPPLQSIQPTEEFSEQILSFDQSVEAFERKLLRHAYLEYGSSYKIAEVLGISQTKASRLLRKYNIR